MCVPLCDSLTASVKPGRCPACQHKRGESCAHERGELAAYPGTLGTPPRLDGLPWYHPGNGSQQAPCACRSRSPDDFSICRSSLVLCRRAGTRTIGILLYERERIELRAMLAKALACGSGLIARRRLDVLPEGGVRETRVITLAACGLRWCVKCEAGARRYRSQRAIGPWGFLSTLTLDPHRIGLRRAWRILPKWIGILIRRMQRSAELVGPGPVAVHEIAAAEITRWREEMTDRKRAIPKVIYAWAIEPHQNGFPHVHICLGLSYLNHDWMRAQWREITGMGRCSPQNDPVKEVLASSRYLHKYITKAVFPADLCIISKRKRLFWSAVPLAWKPPAGWLAVDKGGPTAIERLLDTDRQAPAGMAWSDSVDPSDSYRRQTRDHPNDFPSWSAMGAGIRAMPADWDGGWHEWAQMSIAAGARAGGQWSHKVYHEERAWLRRAMLAYIVRCLAVNFARGRAVRWNLKWWRPVRVGCERFKVRPDLVVPACKLCRPSNSAGQHSIREQTN